MATEGASAWAGLEALVLTPVPTHPGCGAAGRRLLELCRVLKAQGARLTLLHHPLAWRERMPAADHAAMTGFFDEVHLIPVTCDGPGWDPAIGTMLDWLCRVRRFDAMLVHGAALARAFGHGPAGALRVLVPLPGEVPADTGGGAGERLGPAAPLGAAVETGPDRAEPDTAATGGPGAQGHPPSRIAWASSGAAPAAGAADRRIGPADASQAASRAIPDDAAGQPTTGPAGRADIVWVGSAAAAAQWRSDGSAEILDAPHAPALARVAPVGAWRDGGPVLRLGVAGDGAEADGLRALLALAEPVLRRTLLPVEVVVGGTLCDAVPDLARSWVRLLDGEDEGDALAGSVDAVLAPGSALGTAIADAMARGAPLIALAGALDDVPDTHALHRCADHAAMLGAIRAVAREPALLDGLAEASAAVARHRRRRLEQAVAETGRQARAQRREVLLVAEAASLRPDNLVFDHLRDAAALLGARASVCFHLLGDPARAAPSCLRRLREFGAITTESGDGAVTLAEALSGRHAALFAALPAKLPANGPAFGAANLDVLALAASPALLRSRVPALARSCGTFRLLRADGSALAAAILGAAGPAAGALAMPMLARGEDALLVRTLRAAPAGDGVAVLAGRGGAAELVPILAFLAGVLRLRPLLFSADGLAPRPPESGPLALPQGALRMLDAAAFYAPATHRRGRPRFVVELGAAPCFGAAREIMLRARIPMARVFDTTADRIASLRAEACARSDGLLPALLALDHLAAAAQHLVPVLDAEAAHDAAGNAGWAALLQAICAGAESPSA